MDESKEFELAREFAASFGNYSAAFTTTIRTLLNDEQEARPGEQPAMSDASRFLVSRLVKCPSILAPLYFSALTFHENKLKEMQCARAENLITLYTPRQLAAILGVIYIFRRIEGKCDPDQWQAISDSLQLAVDIGMHLGYAIPDLDPARGLLTAACKGLAWGTFAIQEPGMLKKYRISLRVHKLPFDLEKELELWGTTHLHIGSIILCSLGFGKEFANAYFAGGSDLSDPRLDQEAVLFRVTMQWMNSLATTGEPPETTLGDHFKLSEDTSDQFVDLIQRMLIRGSKHRWLAKRKEDIDPVKTPDLYIEPAPQAADLDISSDLTAPDSCEEKDLDYDELAEEIRLHFPEDELRFLMNQIQELLDEEEQHL
jgi:hypothetical protein